MEGMEAHVNKEEILRDFKNGLNRSEMEGEATPGQSPNFVPDKLAVNFPKFVSRFVCDWKNKIASKIISKDMSEDDKEFIYNFLKTSDDEIKIYSQIMGMGATEFMPENYKEWLNKWLLHPFFLSTELLIEFEGKRLLELRRELKIRQLDKKEVAI